MTNGVFDTHPNGDIVSNPLLSFTSVSVADMFILVRLEYADGPERFEAIMLRGERAPGLQLAITPTQAMELADRLRSLAEAIQNQKPPLDKGAN